MTIMDEIHALASKVAPYLALVQTLESATGLGGPPAAIAVQVIKVGVDALVAQGKISTATASQIETELRALLANVTASEAADDAESDAIVAARRGAP